MTEEPLINLRPQTTSEKLLWERHMNKALSKELSSSKLKVGELQSEIDELKDQVKKSTVGALVIKNRRLQTQVDKTNKKLNKLKRDNEDLMSTLVKLQLDEKALRT